MYACAKKVAGYIFPVQLSSRVVLQLLIRRIYKLLDAYTGYAEFFFFFWSLEWGVRRPQAVHDHGYKLVMYLVYLAAPKKKT